MEQINISKIFIAVFLTATLVLAYLVSQQVIRNQAIDGCFKAGIANFKNDAGQQVSDPDGYWYQLCLKEKGIK